MDIHGLTHLTNILYREDELRERIRRVYKWMKEKELTQDEFNILVGYCNKKSVENSKLRRYGNNKSKNL
jgi:hypothetical protein